MGDKPQSVYLVASAHAATFHLGVHRAVHGGRSRIAVSAARLGVGFARQTTFRSMIAGVGSCGAVISLRFRSGVTRDRSGDLGASVPSLHNAFAGTCLGTEGEPSDYETGCSSEDGEQFRFHSFFVFLFFE